MSEQPNPRPQNERRDLITRFREEYATALADAEVSEQHTVTEGWHRLYTSHQKQVMDRRRQYAETLKKLAGVMEQTGLDEAYEKELGEVKKGSLEMRTADAVFELETVNPVRDPVTQCERLISEARAQSRRDEQNAPLVNVGLEELMKDAIADVRRAKWDAEAGRVTVVEPESGYGRPRKAK